MVGRRLRRPHVSPGRGPTGHWLRSPSRSSGEKAGSAKPTAYVGKGTYAITADHDGETYRTFYVARFSEAVYCFYVVHKKAASGIDLPKRQKDQAARLYREIVEWRSASGLR